MTQLDTLQAMQERRLLAQERRLLAARNTQAHAHAAFGAARRSADLLREQAAQKRAALDSDVLGQKVSRSVIDRVQQALAKLHDALGTATEKVKAAQREVTRADEAIREALAIYALQTTKTENFRALVQEERADLAEAGLAAEEAERDDTIWSKKWLPATA